MHQRNGTRIGLSPAFKPIASRGLHGRMRTFAYCLCAYQRRLSISKLTLVIVACGSSLNAQEQANSELVEMVVGFLAEEDKDIRSLALEQIRSAAPGAAATREFAKQLPTLSLESQIGLLSALADRGDPVAKSDVLALLKSSDDDPVRVAAVRAVGKLGDATDCSMLIELLRPHSDPIGDAARDSLIQLRGSDVPPAIIDGLLAAAPPMRVALIEILTARRALTSIPTLLDLAVGDDAFVRAAAMASLGQLAEPEHISRMTRGVLTAVRGEERSAAEKSLMFVCNRIEDKDKRAEPLLDAMQTLDPSEQFVLLPALGRIGGGSALSEVQEAIASPESAWHAAGVRAISNWPDASVAEKLIDLATTDPHSDHRQMSRRALIRIAPLPDGRTDLEKLELLKAAFQLAESAAERNFALRRAAAIRSVATLRFVLPFVDQAPHAEQACQTIVELAHHRELRDEHKAEFHDALDKVLRTATDSVVIDRATRYKKGQTWVRPK